MKNTITTPRSGSEIFGTKSVRTEEYVLLAKVITENGGTVQQAALEIDAIDDMLMIMKSQSIIRAMSRTRKGTLRKDAQLSDLLGGRIGVLVDDLAEMEVSK